MTLIDFLKYLAIFLISLCNITIIVQCIRGWKLSSKIFNSMDSIRQKEFLDLYKNKYAYNKLNIYLKDSLDYSNAELSKVTLLVRNMLILSITLTLLALLVFNVLMK